VQTMIRRSLAAAGLAVAFAASVAWAQNPPVRVRGTIDKVDGDALMVKSRDGTELKVMLAPNATATAIVKASLADIKQGSYVGVTGMPQPDGSQKAVEVHIFMEAQRGLGEGHRPWDLQPQSTMTNANVEQAVTAVDGQALTLKYKDGEKKIIVPPDAQIVAFAPGSREDLKPGVKIFAITEKQADGSLQAARVNYGKDGVTPPM
jgi:hypothetical protein